MAWFKNLLRRPAMERCLDAELNFHFENQVRDYIASGMTGEAARRRARLEFGTLEAIKDDCRDVRPLAWINDLRQDLIYALRNFRRSPGFTTSCVLTLAIAIGASTAVFSILHAVVLQSLPYRDADRLALLWTDDPKHAVHTEGVSLPNFDDWRNLNRVFESMTFFIRTEDSQMTLSGNEAPDRVQIAAVPAEFFKVLGVSPLRGRAFTHEEDAHKVEAVLISERIWTRRFGRSDSAIGGTIEINGVARRIFGVMPNTFRFPYWNTDVWFPQNTFMAATQVKRIPPGRYADWLGVIGLLKPGISINSARADMARVANLLRQAHQDAPADYAGFGVTVVPLFDHFYGAFLRPALWIVFGAVCCILLIGSLNVGSLLLTRSETRRHEFAVRKALGAGNARLGRQLLTESALLAVISTLVGLAFARAGLQLLIQLVGPYVPRLELSRLRGEVFLFAIAMTAATALVCGFAPIWKLRRASGDVLHGVRGTTDARTRLAMNGLVMAQIAVAMILCTGAGLLLQSFLKVSASAFARCPVSVV